MAGEVMTREVPQQQYQDGLDGRQAGGKDKPALEQLKTQNYKHMFWKCFYI